MILTISPGAEFSSSVAVAPKRNGKIARPPSPNVKASGGDPTKTSSGVRFAAIVRAAHGAGHSFAAARPYRNDAERSGYGNGRRPRHIEPGADVGAGRAIVPTGR